MSDLNWDALPNTARWYGEVVYSSANDDDTVCNYGYCSNPHKYPSPTLLAPPNCQILEVRVIDRDLGGTVEKWNAYESMTDYRG